MKRREKNQTNEIRSFPKKEMNDEEGGKDNERETSEMRQRRRSPKDKDRNEVEFNVMKSESMN